MAKTASKKKEANEIQPWMYDVVLTPRVTEKSTLASENNQVVFNVATSANKGQIKQAVEAIWGVSVVSVNTIVQKGKVKVFKGRTGKRSDEKKAIIRLKDGDVIDLSAAIK